MPSYSSARCATLDTRTFDRPQTQRQKRCDLGMVKRQTFSERDRLLALREMNILDSAEEAAFDRITRLAAALFEAPIALVSLVDAERQWFKSRVGLDACETGRDASFCAHALGRSAPLVVEDAALDPKYQNNPLVTGQPHIRFYAGAQLRTSKNLDLGTLCVIDTKPRRTPGDQQLSFLQDLAATTVLLIEQRRVMLEYGSEVEARRAAEDRLRKAKEEAESATRSMRSLFSRVSHDLRTPLAAISGFSELLAETSMTDEQRSDLEEVRRAGRNMLVMVDSLLQLARENKEPL